MDAIKFLADCIRLERKAQAEAAKEKQEMQNRPASVEETAGAVNPKTKEESSEEPETAEPEKDTEDNTPVEGDETTKESDKLGDNE